MVKLTEFQKWLIWLDVHSINPNIKNNYPHTSLSKHFKPKFDMIDMPIALIIETKLPKENYNDLTIHDVVWSYCTNIDYSYANEFIDAVNDLTKLTIPLNKFDYLIYADDILIAEVKTDFSLGKLIFTLYENSFLQDNSAKQRNTNHSSHMFLNGILNQSFNHFKGSSKSTINQYQGIPMVSSSQLISSSQPKIKFI